VGGTVNIIGQGVGIIAFIVMFGAYQMNTSKKLLFVQTVAIACFCVHYLLIGEIPGFALNVVCIVRNVIFYHKDKKFFAWKLWPYVLAVVMLGLGILTWDKWYSVLLIIGLTVNTVCMSLPTSQGIRKSLLVTCPPVLVYNICALSIGGIINESLSIISSVIGIVRYAKSEGQRADK